MKSRMLLIPLLIAAPTLALAGDPPSETARAERQRTIEKRKSRKAQSHALAQREEARRRAEAAAAAAGSPALLQAAAANKAARTASLNQASAALNAPLISAPRANSFASGGFSSYNSIYNPYNPDPYMQLYGAQAYGATNLFGVPVGTVAGQGGLSITAPGVGLPAAPAGPPNPVTINK